MVEVDDHDRELAVVPVRPVELLVEPREHGLPVGDAGQRVDGREAPGVGHPVGEVAEGVPQLGVGDALGVEGDQRAVVGSRREALGEPRDAPDLAALDEQRVPGRPGQGPDERGDQQHGGSGNLDVQRTSSEYAKAGCAGHRSPRTKRLRAGAPATHDAMVPNAPRHRSAGSPAHPRRRAASWPESTEAAAASTRRPPSQTPSIRSGRVSKSYGSPSTTTRSASLPGLDRPELVVDAQQLGGAPRRRLEDGGGRHPEVVPSARARAGSGRAASRPRRCPSRCGRRPRSPCRTLRRWTSASDTAFSRTPGGNVTPGVGGVDDALRRDERRARARSRARASGRSPRRRGRSRARSSGCRRAPRS